MNLTEPSIRLIRKRVEQRREREMPAFVYREDGSRVPATLVDLSYSGCRLRSNCQLEAGERLCLVLVRLGAEIALTVQWARGRDLGAMFVTDLAHNGA